MGDEPVARGRQRETSGARPADKQAEAHAKSCCLRQAVGQVGDMCKYASWETHEKQMAKTCGPRRPRQIKSCGSGIQPFKAARTSYRLTCLGKRKFLRMTDNGK